MLEVYLWRSFACLLAWAKSKGKLKWNESYDFKGSVFFFAQTKYFLKQTQSVIMAIISLILYYTVGASIPGPKFSDISCSILQ